VGKLPITIKDIVIILLGTFASFCLAYAFAKAVEFFRVVRPFFRLWRFGKNDTVYLINGIIEENTASAKGKFILGAGDVKALVELARGLEKRYSAIHVKNLYAKQLSSADMMNEHIVCIGGPKRNEVTRKLMDTIETRYSFDSGELIDRTLGKKYSPKKAEKDNHYAIDYGIVIKACHAPGQDKWAYILAGCHTEGVMGAARYISSLDRAGSSRIHRLTKEFGKGPFEIAIKCAITKDAMGVIEPQKLERLSCASQSEVSFYIPPHPSAPG